jgi:hypothetical protein
MLIRKFTEAPGINDAGTAFPTPGSASMKYSACRICVAGVIVTEAGTIKNVRDANRLHTPTLLRTLVFNV